MQVLWFDITDDTTGIIILLVWFAIFLWMYTVLWVAKDISRRTESFSLQLVSILLVLFLTPLLWLPLYFLLRPLDSIDSPSAMQRSSDVICYGCWNVNKDTFTYCVFCGDTLKIACPNKACLKPIGVDYEYCPWCGNEIV